MKLMACINTDASMVISATLATIRILAKCVWAGGGAHATTRASCVQCGNDLYPIQYSQQVACHAFLVMGGLEATRENPGHTSRTLLEGTVWEFIDIHQRVLMRT
jgi:hypothetical protein